MKFDRITVNNVYSALKEDATSCDLVDVRDLSDFLDEHIEGSGNVPLMHLTKKSAAISRNKPVYLVCTNGKLATDAADALRGQGFENVYVMAGGLLAWNAQGFPVKHGRHSWLYKREGRIAAGLTILLFALICCDGSWKAAIVPGIFATVLIASAFADLVWAWLCPAAPEERKV